MKTALTVQALAQGFHLEETDDHVVELWCAGQKLATYSQRGITIEEIQHQVEETLLAERRN